MTYKRKGGDCFHLSGESLDALAQTTYKEGKMMTRKICLIGLSIVFLLSLFSAPVSAATPLDKIIEAAKNEGKVNWLTDAEDDLDALQQGVKRKFGVDIKITRNAGRMAVAISNVTMEIKAGAAPQYDLLQLSVNQIVSVARPEGILPDIDWQSLMTKDTNPHMYIPPPCDYLYTWGYIQAMAYNSEKISLNEVPKRNMDLTDSKWKGKFGWVSFSGLNTGNTYWMGLDTDKGVQFVEDLVANKPIMGPFQVLQKRLMLGEVHFAMTRSRDLNEIQIKNPNTPLKFIPLQDFVMVNEYTDAVLKNAKNQNAATLLVLFLASPEGQEIRKQQGYFHYADPGGVEYQIVKAAEKDGVRLVYPARDTAYLEWINSSDFDKRQKQVGVALKGGGGKGGPPGGGGKK